MFVSFCLPAAQITEEALLCSVITEFSPVICYIQKEKKAEAAFLFQCFRVRTLHLLKLMFRAAAESMQLFPPQNPINSFTLQYNAAVSLSMINSVMFCRQTLLLNCQTALRVFTGS